MAITGVLVRKLGKEFLVPVAEIEWLQAQANYVNLHVGGKAYPLRSTMAAVSSCASRFSAST